MSDSLKQWLPVSAVVNTTRMRLTVLEDRVNPAYLFIDYGDRFPLAGLNTTTGALNEAANANNPDDVVLGPTLPDKTGNFDPAAKLNIGAASVSAADRATILAFNRRLYAPFDITVVELGAQTVATADGRFVRGAASLNDAVTTLRAGNAALKDAYVFVGVFTTNQGTANQFTEDGSRFIGTSPGAGFGVASDLTTASNKHDDFAVALSNNGLTVNDIELTVAHEAGHQFGLQHAVTDQIGTDPIPRILHASEAMSYVARTPAVFFSRYPVIRGDSNSVVGPDGNPANYDDLEARRGKFTPYDQLVDDPGVGANPNFTFVSGTGGNDRIAIRRTGANQALVTVQSFYLSNYSPFSAIEVPGTQTAGSIYSYTIPLDRTILVYGGTGSDEITVDGDLGVNVDVRGMSDTIPQFNLASGTNTLIVNGQGAPTATFVPDSQNRFNVDMVSSLKGTLSIGKTTISFESSSTKGLVRVNNVGTVTFVSPGGVDNLSLTSGAVPTLSGTVNSGVRSLSLGLDKVGQLFVDGSTNDTDATSDKFGVDLSAGAATTSLLGGVTFNGGAGNDSITVVGDNNYAATDNLITTQLLGPINLVSVEGLSLVGGASSNTFDLTGRTTAAAVDGKGGIDTLIASNKGTNYTVSRPDIGNADGRITFESVGNLIGGDGDDRVIFTGDGRLSGALVGGKGANFISLDGLNSPQVVRLSGLGADSGFDGVIDPVQLKAGNAPTPTVAGGFSDFSEITASALAGDAIVGLDGNSTWDFGGTRGSYRDDASGRLLTYNSFESIYGGSARDLFTIRSASAAGTTVSFFGLGGDDSFRVGSTANVDDTGDLNGILANIAIDGGVGNNALVVSDYAGDGNANVNVTADTIAGLAPGVISYRATGGGFGTVGDGVVIRGSNSGADNFQIRGTLANASTRIEGLGGDDTFFVTGPGDRLSALGGQLVLAFGAGNDSVTVSDRGNLAPTVGTLSSLQISGVGLKAGLFYQDAPENLAVELGSGADTFTVQGTSPGTAVRVSTGAGDDRVFVRAIASPTLVQTGDGDDTILVASDAGSGDIGTLAQIVGDLTVDAGGGFGNRLVVSDYGGGAHPNVVIGASRITGLAPGAIGYASTGGGFAASGGLIFRGSNFAPDSFTVVGSIANSGTRIEGLGGDDSFTVSGQNGDLDTLLGAVFVDGGGGTNDLSVNDVNATRGNSAGRISGTQVAGFAGPNNDVAVNYANVRSVNVRGSEFADNIVVSNPAAVLTLDAGGGDDAVRVEALSASVPARILLGAGDDTADVGGGPSGLRAILGDLSFDGGTGRNTLSISDAGSTLGAAGVRVTAGQVTGLAGPGGVSAVNYAAFANLNLRGSEAADGITLFAATAAVSVDGGGGDDVIRVEAVSGGLPATVSGGGGNDQLTVTNLDAIQAPLTVTGGGGVDRLAVTDLGNEGRAYTLSRTTLGRQGFAGLTYADIDAMTLRGGDGGNQYNVAGTGAASSTVVDDGAGNSTFNIKGDGLTGRSGFNGNGGDDTFNVDGSNGLTGASVAVAVVGGGGNDTLKITARPGDDLLTLRAVKPAIGTLDGLGQTANFETVENVQIDGQGGTNTLAYVDDTDTVYGSATDPDAGIVYRPTGAASGGIRLGNTPFPTVSFAGINGLLSVSGDGDGSGDRDTLTVVAPDGGPQTLFVSDSSVQVANAGGNLRAVNPADGNGRPSIGTLIARGGDGNDTFTVQPSSRINILADGGAGVDQLLSDGPRGRSTPSSDPQFGPPQVRTTFPGGASYGTVNIERAPGTALLVSGAAAPGGSQVTVVDPETGEKRFDNLTPFPGYGGGLSVAAGDVNGDGVADIVVGAGLGGGPVVVVYDGVTGEEITRFFAYEQETRSGVQVAVGDINGDGFADIVTGTGVGGGPRVQVFSGKDFSQLLNYFAYEESFRGGVTVAAADTNGDGFADIITGTGPGGAPRVTVTSGKDLAVRADFFAFDENLRGGVAVAAGDVNGDGVADFVVATGSGSQTLVRAYSGLDATLLADSAVEDAPPALAGTDRGTRVGTADVDGDGIADILLSNDAAGPPLVRGYKVATRTADGVTLGFNEVLSKALFAPDFQSGSSIAGVG